MESSWVVVTQVQLSHKPKRRSPWDRLLVNVLLQPLQMIGLFERCT